MVVHTPSSMLFDASVSRVVPLPRIELGRWGMIGFGQTRIIDNKRSDWHTQYLVKLATQAAPSRGGSRERAQAQTQADDHDFDDVAAMLSSIRIESEVVWQETMTTTPTSRLDGVPLRDPAGTRLVGEQI